MWKVIYSDCYWFAFMKLDKKIEKLNLGNWMKSDKTKKSFLFINQFKLDYIEKYVIFPKIFDDWILNLERRVTHIFYFLNYLIGFHETRTLKVSVIFKVKIVNLKIADLVWPNIKNKKVAMFFKKLIWLN